jgi:hypothetical protein
LKLAQKTDVLLGSAFTATKLIKFCKYKIIGVHELKQPDYAGKNSFLQLALDPQLLFVIDEAWFHVSGHVNAQNVRIWSDENPYATQQVPRVNNGY